MIGLAYAHRILIAALVVAAGWIAGGIQSTRAAALLPAYFAPNAAAPLAPTMFMQLAPPPTSPSENATQYAFGPITDSVSLNVAGQNSSTWTGRNWPFVWVNRARVAPGQVIQGPNPIYPAIVNSLGVNCATEFSTVARANAVTNAEVLYILGAAASVWQAPLIAAGMSASDALTWSQVNARPDAYFGTTSQDGSSKVTVDKMIIPQSVSKSAYGISLDYEVHDARPPWEGEGFLDKMGSTIRSYGKKAYLYTNPWESDETPLNGFNLTGMDKIKSNFDYISLFVWGAQNECNINSTGWNQAITFLKGTSGKLNDGQLVLTIDLFNCTSVDALAIFTQMQISHFAGYTFWPDGANMGGKKLTGSNLIIWTLMNG